MRKFVKIVQSTMSGIRCRSSATLLEPVTPKASVDKDEVERMGKLSEGWWDVNGEMRPLHAMNKLRVQLIRDCLVYRRDGSLTRSLTPNPLTDLKILDVGCGGGILCEPLARIGAKVTGLDPSPSLIEIASHHAERDPDLRNHLNYVVGSIEEHAVNHVEEYDAVIASEVIEHVTEKDIFLEACAKSLKTGGSVFVTTMNKTMVAWVAGVMSAEYILHLVPEGTHDWEKFISPQETQFMLEKHGCYTKLIHGMLYNFICNEWFWTPSTSINYALHAVKKK